MSLDQGIKVTKGHKDMKIELSTGHAADLLVADTNANWTYHGARALVEYLEDIEHSNGESMDLDIVALRCEYSQYKDLESWYVEYNGEYTDKSDEDIKDFIEDHGTLIEFDGGIIVSSF